MDFFSHHRKTQLKENTTTAAFICFTASCTMQLYERNPSSSFIFSSSQYSLIHVFLLTRVKGLTKKLARGGNTHPIIYHGDLFSDLFLIPNHVGKRSLFKFFAFFLVFLKILLTVQRSSMPTHPILSKFSMPHIFVL